jgi:hypothetical protein
MGTEENKAVVRRFIENVASGRDVSVADDVLAPASQTAQESPFLPDRDAGRVYWSVGGGPMSGPRTSCRSGIIMTSFTSILPSVRW